MGPFRELGAALLERWRRANFDEASFPDLAAATLGEFAPSTQIDPMDVLRWVQQQASLPPQQDVDAKFGQPPITVFHCERFYIDVLFWVDGTTAIHQHAFCGAFQLLHGSSLQSTFRFVPEHRYSELLLSGHLDLQAVEVLKRGDVRTIRSGDGLVHSLFHLDRPSVSLVVRTPGAHNQMIQYSYARSGLAFDPKVQTESLVRATQVLDLLHSLSHADYETMAREWVRGADAYLAFRLLRHMASHYERAQDYQTFVESIRPVHDKLLGAALACADEERRDRYIFTRRQFVEAPELRLFLALLLNLRRRSAIIDVVRITHPDRDPPRAIVGWVDDLAKLDSIRGWVMNTAKKVVDTAAQNILDVPWDECARRVLRELLEDHGLPPRFDADEQDRLAAMRASVLLRPLTTDD